MKKILYTANTYRHLCLCHITYIKYLSTKCIVHTACNSDNKIDGVTEAYYIPVERKPFKLNNLKAIYKLRKIIEREKYDVIHTHTPMGAVVTRLAAIKYRRHHGVKIIYTAHGFHFFKGCPILNYIFYYPIEKLLSRYTDLIITMNDEDYKFAKKHFKTEIAYIPGIGFNKEKFSKKVTDKELANLKKENGLSNKDYIISYIAEISKRKRQMYLLKALKKYPFTNEKILLIGDHYDSKKVEKYIIKNKLDKYVKIIGFNDNILSYLKISDLVISVSKQEGLPLNILEAMYLQKPIIVTNCRGNIDLITNNKNGIVVNMNDKEKLLSSIKYLKDNPEIAKKLAIGSQKIIDKYTIDSVLKIMKKIYAKYIDN